MSKILEKIDMDREILSTMPKNNKKNISKYIQYVQELKQEYQILINNVYDEMNRRYKKIVNIKQNIEIEQEKKEIKEIKNLLESIGTIKTSYEKMGLDRKIYKLGKFYKENLDNINLEILECINKFKEVGIELTASDFNYSIYVNEYMQVFFDEIKNINSDIIKNKFEELYWKCPDIIIHIELNFRYIYIKQQKNIDKYYEMRKEHLLKSISINHNKIEERYFELKKKCDEDINTDKYNLMQSFIKGTLNIKEYESNKIKDEYLRILPEEIVTQASKDTMDEINENSIKFLNSLYEYKNYLKFQYLVEDIKNKYQEKEQHKNSYNSIKKEITSKEKKLEKLNDKIKGKGIFNKKNKKEKQTAEYNSLILEIKDLYKRLDNEEIYTKIINNLNDNCSVYDVLKFASQFYNYLVDCIIENNKTITQEEIENVINDLHDFLQNPYIIIIKNIAITEDKNIPIIISDRYKLLKFEIEKEDINPDNLDNLISSLQNIKNNYYIQKSGIDLNEINFICEMRKIVEFK